MPQGNNFNCRDMVTNAAFLRASRAKPRDTISTTSAFPWEYPAARASRECCPRKNARLKAFSLPSVPHTDVTLFCYQVRKIQGVTIDLEKHG